METNMNDKQFEAFLAVAKGIAESIEHISLMTENIYSELVDLRCDYEKANDLQTDEEWLDELMDSAREFKKNQEESNDDVNIGGIE